MGKLVDLTGLRFERLVVLRRSFIPASERVGSKRSWWVCKCNCGNELIVTGNALQTGNTKSCGCLWRDLMQTHGQSKTGKRTHEYVAWINMRTRCGIPTPNLDPAYAKYAEMGMYENWKNNFQEFYAFLISTIGPHPGEGWSFDRYPNNKRGYFPNNVRWATPEMQAKNREHESEYICECGHSMMMSHLIHHQKVTGHNTLASINIQDKATSEINTPLWFPQYRAAHIKIRRERGVARNYLCAYCKNPANHWGLNHNAVEKLIEKGEWQVRTFSNNPYNYLPLCSKCHNQYDRS
jgi:hypothetical protein